METGFSVINGIVCISAAILLCKWDRRKHLRSAIAFVVCAACICLIAQMYIIGIRWVFRLSLWDFERRAKFRVITISTGYMLALLFSWVSRQLRSGIRTRWILLTCLFPALSVLVIGGICFAYLGMNDISRTAFWLCCVLEIGNIAACTLIYAIQKHTQITQEVTLLHQQLLIQSESILALEKSYRAQRQNAHDTQNQLQTLYRLLNRQEYHAAEEYIGELLGDTSVRIYSVNSGNPIIDAVLHQKYQRAVESGIEMTLQLNDLSDVKLQMNELVVLLANLLDNAIEGCLRCSEEKKIELCILHEDTLFLSVRNTSPEVQISGYSIPTSKEPKNEHGFGLRTIHRIMQHNHAQYSVCWQDGWFAFAAEIPNAR